MSFCFVVCVCVYVLLFCGFVFFSLFFQVSGSLCFLPLSTISVLIL